MKTFAQWTTAPLLLPRAAHVLLKSLNAVELALKRTARYGRALAYN